MAVVRHLRLSTSVCYHDPTYIWVLCTYTKMWAISPNPRVSCRMCRVLYRLVFDPRVRREMSK